MNEITSGHIVKRYDQELEGLHRSVVAAGRLAEKQIVHAVKALEDEDTAAASDVVLRDRELDAMELRVDDAIVHIIARRQPVARDLREVMAVSRIMSDLERIGDQARRIARLAIRFYGGDGNPPAWSLLADIPRLASIVVEMVRKAVDAFAGLDSALALEVIARDERLDEEMKGALRRLSTYLMEDARSIGHVVDITLGLRAIERIGSHAAYVARHAIFLIEGEDVRHQDPEQVRRRIRE